MGPIREQFMCQHPSLSSTLQDDPARVFNCSSEEEIESEDKAGDALDSSSSPSPSSSSLVFSALRSPKQGKKTAARPERGDLTGFVLEKLQLLAGKYEEQGDVWRAQGFRIASGAIRLRCGVAASAAARAREEALKRGGENRAGGGENKEEIEQEESGKPGEGKEGERGRRTRGGGRFLGGATEEEEGGVVVGEMNGQEKGGVSRPSSSVSSETRRTSTSSSCDRLRAEGITRENYKLLRSEPGIGKSIFQTIEELVLTGTTRRLESLVLGARPKALEDLQRIWGVGFHTAERLYALGIHSVTDLRKAVALSDERERLREQQQLTHEVYVQRRDTGIDKKEDNTEKSADEAARKGEGEGEVARKSLKILDDIFGPQIHTETREGRSSAWLTSGVRTPHFLRKQPKNLTPSCLANSSVSLGKPLSPSFGRARTGEGSKNVFHGVNMNKIEEAGRLLSRPQRLGLMYVEAFERRIPREEVTAVATFIQTEILSEALRSKKPEKGASRLNPQPGGREASALVRAKEERAAREPARKRVKSEGSPPPSPGKQAEPRLDPEDTHTAVKSERRGDEETWGADSLFLECSDVFVGMEVCGSYRRGKADCGDIDILLVRRNDIPKGTLKGYGRRETSLHTSSESKSVVDELSRVSIMRTGKTRRMFPLWTSERGALWSRVCFDKILVREETTRPPSPSYSYVQSNHRFDSLSCIVSLGNR